MDTIVFVLLAWFPGGSAAVTGVYATRLKAEIRIAELKANPIVEATDFDILEMRIQ